MSDSWGPDYDIDHDSAKSVQNRSALLLTGGSSRRMGTDKASLIVGNEPLAQRLARQLLDNGWKPTVLGRSGLEGYAFLPDREPNAGPLAALRGFSPTSDLIFVLSCDVPLFDPILCEVLANLIGAKDAAIPMIQGKIQPLCALYRKEAWQKLVEVPSNRIFDWVETLDSLIVSEGEFHKLGADPVWCAGANTPQEFRSLTGIPTGTVG
jgi:molybdenum cofactor guanylyltransferase